MCFVVAVKQVGCVAADGSRVGGWWLVVVVVLVAPRSSYRESTCNVYSHFVEGLRVSAVRDQRAVKLGEQVERQNVLVRTNRAISSLSYVISRYRIGTDTETGIDETDHRSISGANGGRGSPSSSRNRDRERRSTRRHFRRRALEGLSGGLGGWSLPRNGKYEENKKKRERETRMNVNKRKKEKTRKSRN